MHFRIGIDTGGTFTDFVFLDENGALNRWKTLSTPSDPARAIKEGLDSFFGPNLPTTLECIHGTTVGTNAFLERKGARTVLLTTKGFEDCLFIGRQARESLYDLNIKPRRPIIPRQFVYGVDERMDWQGNVVTPLDEASLKKALRFVKRRGAESVACVFLHSYANNLHEKMVKEAVEALGIPCDISSRVLPRFREFERLSTTLINAYIGPKVVDYIRRLEALFGGNSLLIQLSNGGTSPAALLRDHAVQTLLSGPAGGVQGALALAKTLGIENIMTFDMGGTSTDCSICPGDLTYTRSYTIEGYPVAMPIIDIHTVGAGGGSIAWIDKGGILRVGPESAGADPGPVCYGKGEEITVTDANCFLGRLLPEAFLGGRMHLQKDRITPRMESLAKRLGMSPLDTALGIIKIVNTNMVQALRAISVERGYDPRDFTLVTFGGAGGLHAAFLADELGIRRILFPSYGGVFSALGMVNSSIRLEREHPLLLRSAEGGDHRILEEIHRLRRTILKDLERANIPIGDMASIGEQVTLEARYRGQSHEIEVPFASNWQETFHQTHKRLYGYHNRDEKIEVTSLRLGITVSTHKNPQWSDGGQQSTERTIDTPQKVPIYFEKGLTLTPCRYRSKVRYGEVERGPLLIIDDYTTILCPEGWTISNREGHLIMERDGAPRT